jgi:hypothetical protein
MADPRVTEASGIVASRLNPGVLWVHNDSGDDARLYALAADGASLGSLKLTGVEASDFEDIAAARCPGGDGHCLWVGDVGNNNFDRQDLSLIIVEEPLVGVQGLGDAEARPAFVVELSYPGDPINSEALIVEPDGSGFALFEKIDGRELRVFGHSGAIVDGARVDLEELASLDSPGIPIERGLMVTGADLHPSGDAILLRLYTGVFEYRLERGGGVESMGSVEPSLVVAGPLSEAQGEAVAYDEEGTGVWTVSEDRQLMPGQMLHHYRCEF